MLVAARFVQGIGGAMTSAVVLGMIVTMFPEPREQAKAIGVYAFVASAGGSIGLLAGGVLTQAISWHWIFFINVPIGIATGSSRCALLERDKGLGFGAAPTAGRGADHGALMLGVYTIVEPAAEHGWAAADARPRRRLARAARRLPRPRGDRAQPARAAADLPLAQRLRGEPGPGACWSPGCSACSSSARSTCSRCSATTRSRPASPSCLDARHGHAVDALHRAADHALRRLPDAAVPGVVLIAVGLALFVRAPVDGTYVTDVLPRRCCSASAPASASRR